MPVGKTDYFLDCKTVQGDLKDVAMPTITISCWVEDLDISEEILHEVFSECIVEKVI